MLLTEKQYRVLFDLYNECNEAFMALPAKWQVAFYAKLFQKD